MNSIINFSLRNKFAVLLMTFIIAAAGIYSGMKMKLETLPNITIPVVTVMTVYPGATPDEVTEKISKPLEQRLQNLDGVNVVSSSSFQNVSAIQIEYSFKKDMEKAETEAKDAVNSMKFPDGVQAPKVSRINFNAFPVIAISVANKDLPLAALTKKVENDIAPALEGLDGVATVETAGQYVEEAQLVFKQDKMMALGLDEATVQNMIKASKLSMPLGLYTFKDTQKSVVVDGHITTLEDLKAMKIPYTPKQAETQQGMSTKMALLPPAQGMQAAQQGAATGQQQLNKALAMSISLPTVALSEIADIKIVGKASSVTRTNGEEAIGIQIVKASDANTVAVVNNVTDKITQLEKDFDVEITTTFDQGKPIEESVQTMMSKALFGGIFAAIIILLFLRNIRSTIISVISIPMSLLIAILILHYLDITLNMMTLGAMTVAIGRVVDDSIVVIENIYRRMALPGETLRGRDLIREATKEMFLPIMSSTIVTIAVFLPMGLVSGMVGQLFLPFALTIVFALTASLLVAITIVPMLAHSLFTMGKNVSKHNHEEGHGALATTYRKILEWSLKHKLITFGAAILMLVGSLFLVPIVGTSFISSDSEEKMLIVTFAPAPGRTMEDVEANALTAEKYLMGRKGVDIVQYSVGAENPMNPGASNQALFFISYEKDTKDFDKEKETVIKDLNAKSPKGTWATQDMGGAGTSSNVDVYVYGESIDQIKPIVDNVEKLMKDSDKLKNVDTSMSATYQEYTLVANQKKLSQLGLTAAQVGMEISPVRQRPVVTTIEKDGQDMNVYLTVKEHKYNKIDDLLNRTIKTPFGTEVKIKDVVDVKEGATADTLTRRDGKVYVKVTGEPTTTKVNEVSADVQTKLDALSLPSGVTVSMAGVSADIQESFTQLGIAMLAAVAIVYLILVITFGGGLAPLAILVSLPFVVIGALLGLLIAKETISISAMIGVLMLIGIVVTNAIVLIDRVIHKENEGLSTRNALLEAGATRVRPILMTALATIGALLPLAFGFEGSGFISKGLGVTVIGGLTSSTLLTLVVVPIVYEVLAKLRGKKRRNA